MKRQIRISFIALILPFFLVGCKSKISSRKETTFTPPVAYEVALKWADSIVNLMTLEEKVNMIGGDRRFFTNPVPRFNIPPVMMADATMGVRLVDWFGDSIKVKKVLTKSTAFPASILLASTWNRDLARQYAFSVGEECRAGGIAILLGPGMNIYRISQCGRNFEYFGEDPFLAGGIIANYVRGLQSTGTIATLKHFVANNTDFFRRKSNTIVDERALHEIYTAAFKAGIDAGAMAVMTSYNQLNGEWCGQSSFVIDTLLRQNLGYKWLVMTDWSSVYNGAKVIKSGQDLEMPFRLATENALQLVADNQVSEQQIDRMTRSILATLYAMQSFDRKPDTTLLDKFDEHEQIALRTAREGIILLRNEDHLLPIQSDKKKILLTGEYIDKIAQGGGAAIVAGYDHVTPGKALTDEFAERLLISDSATDEEIRNSDAVILSIGTFDSEGWDRPFNLPADEENLVMHVTSLNPHTIVVVNSGSGINMSAWNEKAGAIIYAWYGGQTGAKAVAEIIAGKVNPSGKLPITIEKSFKDSPGFGYIPEGEQLYTGWNGEAEILHPVFDIKYKEGIFVGYRWYEKNDIEPLYPFGFGLSYTRFSYKDIGVSKSRFGAGDEVSVTFTISNTGNLTGSEIAQLYIQDVASTFPRPVKELKGFEKVSLEPGKSKRITIKLKTRDFSYWNPKIKDWYAEPGKFIIMAGSSSADIELTHEVEMTQ
jgi:beta-glucosidase